VICYCYKVWYKEEDKEASKPAFLYTDTIRYEYMRCSDKEVLLFLRQYFHTPEISYGYTNDTVCCVLLIRSAAFDAKKCEAMLAQGKRNLFCGEVPKAVNELQEVCRLLYVFSSFIHNLLISLFDRFTVFTF